MKNKINEILDNYNSLKRSLSDGIVDRELDERLIDEMKSDFILLCYKLKKQKQNELPIRPILSLDAMGDMRPDWDANLPE